MMKKAILFLLLVVFTGRSDAAEPEHPAALTVKQFFSAISAFDAKAMKAVATDDFLLLEHGEVWDINHLIRAIQPKETPYQRENFIKVIDFKDNGDSVSISYWSKAHFSSERGSGDMIWLESAVIIKQKSNWKIQQLHSTRLERERFPKNIEWEINAVESVEKK